MPRKPIIRSNEHFYHVTCRSNNKENFHVEKELSWRIMVHRLKCLQLEHSVKIGAFVLMDNHFHLLVLTPDEPIDRIMYFFMKEVTRDLQKAAKRINKIFGGRYKGSLILTDHYLYNVLKYIYRNPVAAGITERPEDYNFSTAREDLPGLNIDRIFENDRVSFLRWINRPFAHEEAGSIKTGLRKSQFQYQKVKCSGKLIVPIVDTLFMEKCVGT